MTPAFIGIGFWELLIVLAILGTPLLIAAVVILVVLGARKKQPPQA